MNPPDKYTVYDVAEKAGVSVATVSRVLNSPELVREDTRRKVLDAIDALGFVPEADASARARKTLGRIGVITPFFTYPSFIQRLRGIAAALANTHYEMVIYPVETFDRLDGYLGSLTVTRRVDGLISISLPLNESSALRLQQYHLETVLIEGWHANFSTVQTDNFNGGCLAADYLIGKGHTRFAYIGTGNLPNYTINPEVDRLAGYRQTLESNGFALLEPAIKYPAISHMEIRQAFDELLKMPEPPTAVFAVSDNLAIRILRAAREAGVQIPKDMAVIGFDDMEFSEQVGLTTINQSLDESGRIAVGLLLARIENPERPVQRVVIGLRVIPRETA